jgi:hypothetical protein
MSARKEIAHMLQIRVVKYTPWNGNRSELVTLAEAAQITGLTLPGVVNAVARGVLTEIIDDREVFHGRRLLIRAEVEAFQVHH